MRLELALIGRDPLNRFAGRRHFLIEFWQQRIGDAHRVSGKREAGEEERGRGKREGGKGTADRFVVELASMFAAIDRVHSSSSPFPLPSSLFSPVHPIPRRPLSSESVRS